MEALAHITDDLLLHDPGRLAEKITFRLAQRPGSYVVMKYVRPVIKRLDTQKISCPPAPQGVIEGSRADVSFCAGLLVDKFVYPSRCIASTCAWVIAGSRSAGPG